MNDHFPQPYSDRLAGLENGKKHLNVNFFSSKSLSKQIRALKTDIEDKTNFLTVYQNNLTAQNKCKNKFFMEKFEEKIPNVKYSTKISGKTLISEECKTQTSKFKLMTEMPNRTKYNRRLIHSPEIKILVEDKNVSTSTLSPRALLFEPENGIEKLVSKQHIDNLIFKKHKPVEVKQSCKTTNVHSQITDRTNEDVIATDFVPNLRVQKNLKMNMTTSSTSPLKTNMKSTNNSFFTRSHNQSNVQFFHTKDHLYTLTEQQKKQIEVDNLYDKIFASKRSLYKEPKTNKDCHVMFQGAEKVFVPKKSRYIKDKIKDIYKKISFMKGVFDYAFPKIMVEKMKQNKKEYEEFIDRFHDNIYEKNKKLEKKFKTQSNYNLNRMADPNLPSEKGH
jgi:hypothetical protein